MAAWVASSITIQSCQSIKGDGKVFFVVKKRPCKDVDDTYHTKKCKWVSWLEMYLLFKSDGNASTCQQNLGKQNAAAHFLSPLQACAKRHIEDSPLETCPSIFINDSSAIWWWTVHRSFNKVLPCAILIHIIQTPAGGSIASITTTLRSLMTPDESPHFPMPYQRQVIDRRRSDTWGTWSSDDGTLLESLE